MDYSIHTDTIIMELPILYLKGSQVDISIKQCISVPEDCFYLTKQAVQTLMKCCLSRPLMRQSQQQSSAFLVC